MAALSWNEIKTRAVAFSKEWENEGYEDGEAKSFLDAFFNVFGVSRRRFIKFENKVKTSIGTDGYIDSIWKGVILVEMKSRGKNLDKAYDQARGYFFGLKESELPRYVLVSDFHHIRLYDLDLDLKWEFQLKELVKKVKLFGFLAGYQSTEVKEQDPVNIKAAEEMGKIHDELKELGYEGHDLELYLVRILFCMFADDTTLFNKNQFADYISQSNEDGSDLAMRLAQLFDVLNSSTDHRMKSLSEDLLSFPYVNGQLFAERLPMAGFTSKMRIQLLNCCRLDWGQVSPAILGSMFQSVMNAGERRSLGAHYTSEENIHKVINPLFLDELKIEFEYCKTNIKKLDEFHKKLADLKFMDPACGCGNFLIIAYRELRLLEIEVMKELYGRAQIIDVAAMAKVNVDQFYGIEIEEFPAQIAQVAMWLIDHQMNMKMSEEFGMYYVRLPLRAKANIINGNSLKVDWISVVDKNSLSYIFGNPPFVGSVYMSDLQKADMVSVFADVDRVGILDYVAAWYIKAAEYIDGTNIRVAFVSTNSITQGEQVPALWTELFSKYRISINFAHRTFRWDNEARGKAAVHCVIIGFSQVPSAKPVIYDYHNQDSKRLFSTTVKNINPYLFEGENIIIQPRSKSLCRMPPITRGNMPYDGNNLIIEDSDLESFLAEEPDAEKYIKRLIGSREYINNQKRWCLWLVGVSPAELRKMPHVMNRIEKVRIMRLGSPDKSAQKLATTPTLFREQNNPDSYMIIPTVSSEKREYIPMGLLFKDTIPTNLVHIIANANYYHFGILSSNMHMAWVKAVCSRLKSDYRYSKNIVYNNFPWPNPLEHQKLAIESAAQAILAARDLYSTSSLADLYDPLTMPPELVKAHLKLNLEVEKSYGRRFDSDADRVAFLFERYAELAAKK